MDRYRVNFLGVLAVFSILFGCVDKKQTEVRFLWPVPPDVPRLEFIGSYKTAGDLPHNDSSRLFENVVGKTPEEIPLLKPCGIFADSGKIYVADEANGNVMVFDLPGRAVGTLVYNGVLKTPLDLDVDRNGNIYVSDAGFGKVLVFSSENRFLYDIGGAENLQLPAHLAIDEMLSRLYVADVILNRIYAYDLSGRLLFSFGAKGGGDGEFNEPRGLAVDHNGNLFVADSGNARIQVFDRDGHYLRKFGRRGNTVKHFVEPVDLAFDSEGNLHIVDKGSASLLSYSPAGRVLLATGSGTKSKAPMGLARPTALHIDANDRIYIADLANRRVSVWQYLSVEYLGKHPIDHAQLVKLEGYLQETAPDGVKISAEDTRLAHTALRQKLRPFMVTGEVKCSSCDSSN